eukprot:m.122416 g.122416  ORF g.122416 m.122416 type:complete len:500 (-) comp11106_c0_seq2:97-1596(-)
MLVRVISIVLLICAPGPGTCSLFVFRSDLCNTNANSTLNWEGGGSTMMRVSRSSEAPASVRFEPVLGLGGRDVADGVHVSVLLQGALSAGGGLLLEPTYGLTLDNVDIELDPEASGPVAQFVGGPANPNVAPCPLRCASSWSMAPATGFDPSVDNVSISSLPAASRPPCVNDTVVFPRGYYPTAGVFIPNAVVTWGSMRAFTLTSEVTVPAALPYASQLFEGADAALVEPQTGQHCRLNRGCTCPTVCSAPPTGSPTTQPTSTTPTAPTPTPTRAPVAATVAPSVSPGRSGRGGDSKGGLSGVDIMLICLGVILGILLVALIKAMWFPSEQQKARRGQRQFLTSSSFNNPAYISPTIHVIQGSAVSQENPLFGAGSDVTSDDGGSYASAYTRNNNMDTHRNGVGSNRPASLVLDAPGLGDHSVVDASNGGANGDVKYVNLAAAVGGDDIVYSDGAVGGQRDSMASLDALPVAAVDSREGDSQADTQAPPEAILKGLEKH